MAELRDDCPAGDFYAEPPKIAGGDTMHIVHGLRWCIAVADDEYDLNMAVSYLWQFQFGGGDEELIDLIKSLFDYFRQRWADGDFECQRRRDDFDFRDMMGPL